MVIIIHQYFVYNCNTETKLLYEYLLLHVVTTGNPHLMYVHDMMSYIIENACFVVRICISNQIKLGIQLKELA